jgi:hypothetical protein
MHSNMQRWGQSRGNAKQYAEMGAKERHAVLRFVPCTPALRRFRVGIPTAFRANLRAAQGPPRAPKRSGKEKEDNGV